MSHFIPIKQLDIYRQFSDGKQCKVGTMVQNAQSIFFQYDAQYLESAHNLSPFKLTSDLTLQKAPKSPHFGLHGVFSDALPDGWGMLLMDRIFHQQGISPHQLTAMDRLAYIGNRGVGALSFQPTSPYCPTIETNWLDTHQLGLAAQNLFEGEAATLLAQLANVGSSGGARPKAQIYIHPNQPEQAKTFHQPELEPWLVKFTSHTLPLQHEEGLCEAAYLTMAKQAGIDVPTWQLITPPETHSAIAWIALKRFDCTNTGRYHLHSLCGLLDADFRTPSMDYQDVIKASQLLCHAPAIGQVQFKRAIFNLFSANQDDHTKNWAFLMDDQGKWQASPFYDVTFSPSPHNEHAISYMGFGQNPPIKAIQRLAAQANFPDWKTAQIIIEQVIDAIHQWPEISKALDIRQSTRKMIQTHLDGIWQKNKHLINTR